MSKYTELYEEIEEMLVNDLLSWKRAGAQQATLSWFFKTHCKGKAFKTFTYKDTLYIA